MSDHDRGILSKSRTAVMVVTTSRADYGILFSLLAELRKDSFFQTVLTVTGSHLDPFYGKTVDQIQKDGFEIAESVKMWMKGDAESDICHAISRGLRGFSKLFQKKSPDLVFVENYIPL